MPKLDYAQQELLRFSVSPIEEDGLTEDDLLGDEELLSETHFADLTNELANKPDGTELAQNLLDDGLLDGSSLATVLDMLAVITSIEELMLLESLSDAQKRQVWSATPETIRNKLKRIREANTATANTATSLANWENFSSKSGDSNQPVLRVGGRVVLLAKPKLTTAELTAIWSVIEIHEGYARIKAENLGIRNYPVSWMVVYP